MTIALGASQYHYHWPNYKQTTAPQFSDLQSTKNKIMNMFLDRFNVYNGIKSSSAANKEAIEILKKFSSNGVIGAQIINELNNLAFNVEQKDGSSFSQLGTGATFGSLMKSLKPSIPDRATRILTSANMILNNMIDVLGKSELNMILAQLKQIRAGVPVDSVFAGLNIKVSPGIYPESQLSIADVANKKTLQTMQELFQQLNGLTSKGNAKTLKEIEAAFAGVFNDLSGTMLEPVMAHATNLAAEKMRELDKQVQNEFQKSGGRVYAISTGQQTKGNSGSQQKNDIELYYDTGKITYSFGGTIKLRQGKDMVYGKGQITNLHSGLTLGVLAEQTLIDNGQAGLGHYYAAALGAIKATNDKRSRFFNGNYGDYKNALNSWEALKQASLMSGLLLALSGSGAKGDFSGVLVYNNKIYSVYEILKHSILTYKNGNEHPAVSITPKNVGSREDFEQLHTSILDFSKRNERKKNLELDQKVSNRQTETANMINEWLNQKIEINLSFATLFSAGLT